MRSSRKLPNITPTPTIAPAITGVLTFCVKATATTPAMGWEVEYREGKLFATRDRAGIFVPFATVPDGVELHNSWTEGRKLGEVCIDCGGKCYQVNGLVSFIELIKVATDMDLSINTEIKCQPGKIELARLERQRLAAIERERMAKRAEIKKAIAG